MFLTANTDSVNQMWVDTEGRPDGDRNSSERPGVLDDHWFQYVDDFGKAGPDKGKGGKYLVLPPGYKGAVPEGYLVAIGHLRNLVFWPWLQVNEIGEPPWQAPRNYQGSTG